MMKKNPNVKQNPNEIDIHQWIDLASHADRYNFLKYCADKQVYPCNSALETFKGEIQKARDLHAIAEYFGQNAQISDISDCLTHLSKILEQVNDCDGDEYFNITPEMSDATNWLYETKERMKRLI
jgi:hypothetical protein